jgi:hypothetical protein
MVKKQNKKNIRYKNPFKYNCKVKLAGNINITDNYFANIDLNYEDGQKIVDQSTKNIGIINKNEKKFEFKEKGKFEGFLNF